MQHQRGKLLDLLGDGEKGEEKEIILELKLLADVGLLGFPNVGKSTFLATVTDAKPKIANYQFTTLEPNLGVVRAKDGTSFVIADIPGIIKGASKGTGLGLQFLRHVERTRLLLHVIDVSGVEGRNPVEDFEIINRELKEYSEKLASRKQIIVASKLDIIQDETLYKELEKFAKEKNIEIFKISSATGEGLDRLLDYVTDVLKTLPKEDLFEEEERTLYTLEEKKDEFEVAKTKDGFEVTGKGVERVIARINIDDNESMYYFHKCLENLGVNAKLKELGVKEGDIVKIEDYEFEWYE